ncbi:hypothetical protein SPWS13_3851 [Shewanella putrefaciens]|nr:hypothetical protein SPWS13_3851 [Shewanella putrefaciens]
MYPDLSNLVFVMNVECWDPNLNPLLTARTYKGHDSEHEGQDLSRLS